MDLVQWDIITFCEEFWRANKFFPSIQEIVKGVDQPETQVNIWLNDEVTKKHLDARGINPRKRQLTNKEKEGPLRQRGVNRLSDRQLAAIVTILNPADNRVPEQKLKSLGISVATYNGWKKNEHFVNFMAQQAEELYGEYMPEIANSLITNAVNGDFKSQKFLYEVTGRYRPAENNQEIADVKFLIIRLIEVIQKHVKDPLVIQAIAEEVKQITNPSLGQQNPVNPIMELASGSVSKSEVW